MYSKGQKIDLKLPYIGWGSSHPTNTPQLCLSECNILRLHRHTSGNLQTFCFGATRAKICTWWRMSLKNFESVLYRWLRACKEKENTWHNSNFHQFLECSKPNFRYCQNHGNFPLPKLLANTVFRLLHEWVNFVSGHYCKPWNLSACITSSLESSYDILRWIKWIIFPNFFFFLNFFKRLDF
jgi:hypothetical protein